MTKPRQKKQESPLSAQEKKKQKERENGAWEKNCMEVK